MSEEKQGKGEKALVSADTLSITKKNGSGRELFYESLEADKDKYKGLKLTPEQVKKVEKVYRRYSTGLSAAVPLICTGENCPFHDTCPYWEIGQVIEGEECKFEYDLVNFYTRRYMEEFDVDPDDYSEVMLISELVELNIYDIRASKILARPENAEMTQIFTTLTAAGDEMDEERVHNAFTIKEKIKTRRMKILEALVATRKERLKVDHSKDNNLNKTMSELRAKLDRLMDRNYADDVRQVAEEVEFEEVK